MATLAAALGRKEEIYGYQTLYRELGYYILRLEQYERACKFFNEAVKKTPQDKRALLGRAWARSKAIQYEGALEDVRKALELDPDDLILLAPKALNTYLSCEFEDGLVQNTRLVPRRQKPDHFVMGVMHCTDAIENCVGERTGRPLRDHFKIIRRLAWKKFYESQKPYEPKSKFKKKKKKSKEKDAFEPVVPMVKKIKKRSQTHEVIARVAPPGVVQEEQEQEQQIETTTKASTTSIILPEEEEMIRESLYTHESERNLIPKGEPFPYRPLQNYTTNIKNYMAEKYLDSMYLDKIFLENLCHEPGVRGPNKGGVAKILQAAKNGYKALCYKQELLRTRRPFYYIKYHEATSSGALKARQEAAEIKLRQTTKRDVEILRTRMVEAVEGKKLKVVLELVEKLKSFLDTKPRRILPDRDMYYQFLYDSVCQAHYDVKRLNKDKGSLEQEKRILVFFGMELSREPSADSVINQYKGVFLDWRKQIYIYEDRLRKATSSQEMAWLYHELSRYYSELKQYEMSRVYARKCINEGIFCGNPKWVINGSMLITKVNIGQQNRNDAKIELNKALEIAREISDQRLQDYLEKCLEVVEKIEFDDLHGPKILERREKKIIDMMPDLDLKSEAAHLFSMMQAMPAHRRMFVMPGVKLDTGPEPSKRKVSQKKQSIMPGIARRQEDFDTDSIKARKKILQGKQGEEPKSTRGVAFMDLIRFHVDL